MLCANLLNDDLGLIQKRFACNKLFLNVKKTHYMVLTPWNKDIKDIDIKINNEWTERVYCTKFPGVQLDDKLPWKKHIEHIIYIIVLHTPIVIMFGVIIIQLNWNH